MGDSGAWAQTHVRRDGIGLLRHRASSRRGADDLAHRNRGRDLHDTVIQRLFVVGLSLQRLQASELPTDAHDRIEQAIEDLDDTCLLYTSPSPRDGLLSRMPSSA